jgi:hypothetical protein
VRVNGGLLWFGEVRAANLRSRESVEATSTSGLGSAFGVAASSGALRASGVMQIVAGPPSPEPPSAPLVKISGQYFDGRAAQNVNDALLASSSVCDVASLTQLTL